MAFRSISFFRIGLRSSSRKLCLQSFVLCSTCLYSPAIVSTTPIVRQDLNSDALPARIDLVDRNDIRFRRLSSNSGLSQTRVEWIAQDKTGFLWLGTQYGLNRYDGYRSKVFKHVPGRSDTLGCVYVRSLLVDRNGNLWVGCERFLDRFDPATETFKHYPIYIGNADRMSTPIDRIFEDHTGMLWLATSKGLYRFDPATGHTTRYVHNANDPSTIAANRVNMAAEDREGHLWIGSAGGLDQLDPHSGKVLRRAPLRMEVSHLHEDRDGLLWLAGSNPSCALMSWDPSTEVERCHTLNYQIRGTPSQALISGMVDSRDGSMWLSSTGGLLRFDRKHNHLFRYHNNPLDIESLESDNLIQLYQDNQGDIWVCSQAAAPSFFSEITPVFENFTYQRGTLANSLVTSIYSDSAGILWIGSMGGLNRIDRRAGTNTVPPGSGVGNEILSILEDKNGVLFSGTFHRGLQTLNRKTGQMGPYPPGSSQQDTDPIMQLMFDHAGNLWAAMYGGIGRYDPSTKRFTMYMPDKQNSIQYQKLAEDRVGYLWLGAQSGLHRFNPRTGDFTVFEHDSGNPRSLSDNRVNAIHLDPSGELWIGTQSGLAKFDQRTGTFENYYEKDGLAGDVVSCIQEDKHGVLWMGTNNGLSSFDPHLRRFRNFSAADGLPGQDLTGWGTCYQSPSGEMFFGGFNGATAFYPDRIAQSSTSPKVVLTDFRLSGDPVPIGPESVLKQSITQTDSITLSHNQNIFSLEFAALSFFNAQASRYRYRLNGLDENWHEVGSDQRIANYTTLPAGVYIFEVQGASSGGPWSQPGAHLRIEVLPAWYQTWRFRSLCLATLLVLLWIVYVLRLRQLQQQFHAALDARVDERTRIARELHDTLLQSFNGLLLSFQSVVNLLPGRPDEAKRRMEGAIDQAADAITEGRDAVHELRSSGSSSIELGQAIGNFGKELVASNGSTSSLIPEFHIRIEGAPRPLDPIIRDEVYRITIEAIRNAVRHAQAHRIEVDILYRESDLRLRIRDDGKGIPVDVLDRGSIAGHWGLRGMKERAKLVGGRFEVWSQPNTGTEIELTILAASAYIKANTSRRFIFPGLWRSSK